MKNKDTVLFGQVQDNFRKAFLHRLRVANVERIRVATIIGLFMAGALLFLDYLRYNAGRFDASPLFFYLFLTHVALFVLIIPLIIIYIKQDAFIAGTYPYASSLIATWTIFVSCTTMSMAVLSILERGSIAMYAITILVVNFVVILGHQYRLVLNIICYATICAAIVFIQHGKAEMMLVNFLEATGLSILGFVVATSVFNHVLKDFHYQRSLREKNQTIKKEKERSHDLLLNILPAKVAAELIIYKKVQPRDYSSATVMMIDFKEFSRKSNLMTPVELVGKIDYCFSAFDHIIYKYGLEKIKTLGDGYLCVGGVPTPTSDHPEKVLHAAMEILEFLENWKKESVEKHENYFEGRVGIHTGPLIAGVVGKSKFAFDIWGDTVNIAARLESNGEAGRINMSKSTFQLLGNLVVCTHRGKVPIKNQEPIDMYFLESIRKKPETTHA